MSNGGKMVAGKMVAEISSRGKIVARKIGRGENWSLGNKIHFQFKSVSN